MTKSERIEFQKKLIEERNLHVSELLSEVERLEMEAEQRVAYEKTNMNLVKEIVILKKIIKNYEQVVIGLAGVLSEKRMAKLPSVQN